MPEITVGDNRIHYTRRGEGPALLLLMGLSGHSAHWGERFPALLADGGLDVVAVDNIGTGSSGPLPSELSIRGMAADAVGVLDALGLEKTHVLGLSMGGMVAQAMALEWPGRVDHLILMATSPSARRGARTPPESLEKMKSAFASGNTDVVRRALFEINFAPSWITDERWEEWKVLSMDRPVRMDVIGAQMLALRGHDALDDLASLPHPTLVVHGTDDGMLPLRNGEMLAEAIPGARLEVVEDAGHLLFYEDPEGIAELVLSFVRGSS